MPLDLFVTEAGPVASGAAVVAIRAGAVYGAYLDFNDNTFKTAGWTTRQTPLTEVNPGVYTLSGGLDVSAFTNLPVTVDHLIAEYEITTPVSGIAEDIIYLDTKVSEVAAQVSGIANQQAELMGVSSQVSGVASQVSGVSSQVSGVQTTLDVVSGDVAQVLVDLAAVSGTVDDVLAAVEQADPRNHRTRTILHVGGSPITGSRFVPTSGVSHLEVNRKLEGGSFPGPETYYVWFTYETTATAASPGRATVTSGVAPSDGMFDSPSFPS